MFKITFARLSSAFIAAHILLASFNSINAQNLYAAPADVQDTEDRAQGSAPVKVKPVGAKVASHNGCSGIPKRVIKLNTNDIYADGTVHKSLWDNYYGAKSLSSYDIRPKPGGKFVWKDDPVCAVQDNWAYDYIPIDEIKRCAKGYTTIGHASGVCTTLSKDNYKKSTQFDCLYEEVLHFNPTKYGFAPTRRHGRALKPYPGLTYGFSFIHSGLKSKVDQAVEGGSGKDFREVYGSITKKPLKMKYDGYYVHAGWIYDFEHVVCEQVQVPW